MKKIYFILNLLLCVATPTKAPNCIFSIALHCGWSWLPGQRQSFLGQCSSFHSQYCHRFWKLWESESIVPLRFLASRTLLGAVVVTRKLHSAIWGKAARWNCNWRLWNVRTISICSVGFNSSCAGLDWAYKSKRPAIEKSDRSDWPICKRLDAAYKCRWPFKSAMDVVGNTACVRCCGATNVAV